MVWMPRTPRNKETLDLCYMMALKQKLDVSEMTEDLRQSMRYRPIRTGCVSCVCRRSEIYSFGSDRMLDVIDLSYLMGHDNNPTIYVNSTFFTENSATAAPGNAMCVPSVAITLLSYHMIQKLNHSVVERMQPPT